MERAYDDGESTPLRHAAAADDKVRLLINSFFSTGRSDNREWPIARLGYRSPAQVRQAFALTPARMITINALSNFRAAVHPNTRFQVT